MRTRVFLVEDEPDIAWVIHTTLVADDFLVTVSVDLASARQAVALGESFDIAIVDLVLPDGDGLDLCEELKARRPTLPVLAISAGTGMRDSALRAGADAYLQKPFDIDVLALEVRRLLQG